MANVTTQVLTVALLLVPILLMCREWMPKWIHRVPFAIISVVIFLRIYAFWTVDLTDAQVVGYLPDDVTGMSTLLHIFDGEAGLMLGLLFGFSAGLAWVDPNVSECRWATLCWILLLGWGIDSDGFATITATALTAQPSSLDWNSVIFPLIGMGLSMLVIPTLVKIENTTPSRLVAAFSIAIVFLDFTSSPVAWMLLGLLAHRTSALRIHSTRGVATQHRWSGLLLTFSFSFFFILIGTSWLALPNEFWKAIWFTRLTIGWILLCGIVGALSPTMGYDAVPRPEAWGFHTGLIIAPALLPNLVFIGFAQLPILVAGITTPILATLPEYRPEIDWKRRCLEGILLVSVFPICLHLTSIIPVSLIAVILILPLLIRFEHPVDEEE